jgi:hypothetical protein
MTRGYIKTRPLYKLKAISKISINKRDIIL